VFVIRTLSMTYRDTATVGGGRVLPVVNGPT